ncbi:glycosyl transferase group 1 [Solidesulfovibrio carbinoliphilus subsp. oakridgensis]|uniref:Glycosyl transferase group 1 n=1 Tax=Solidesulfovibrio carbinoliphilus subsp. oakridgensis TaxID=694327 RepID=G7QCI7_9BACT|nr:glycosyltransferase family 4 protein [Solidesulfovibrio carbinoliphilus]EHJ46143.1 glycosyl transferase group 1 [Solidesulfovibrio carbinoliphilus subsp. oakridgensis]
MKRILVVETGAGFGGALTSLASLLSLLDASRFEVHLLTAYPQDCIRPGGAVGRVEVLPRERRYGPGTVVEAALRPVLGRRAGNAAFLVDLTTTGRRFAASVAAYARLHGIDIIQGNNGILINDAVILAARRAGLPCVVHARGGEYPSRLGSWLAESVARVLAVSGYVAETVAALGLPADRIVAVPEGLDAAAFARGADGRAFRARHGLPADLPLVGLVACLVDWKGQDVFLEACAEALPGSGAGAVVVGAEPDGSGRELARLREKARTLGLGERVWFTGHETDVASAMDACQVVVHASTSPEPFGRVLLEAMALGRPVIATGAGGPREVIEPDTDGLLVPPGDAPAMAGAMGRLLADAGLRERLGLAGRRKVRERYTLAAHVDTVAGVWEELAPGAARGRRFGTGGVG